MESSGKVRSQQVHVGGQHGGQWSGHCALPPWIKFHLNRGMCLVAEQNKKIMLKETALKPEGMKMLQDHIGCWLLHRIF